MTLGLFDKIKNAAFLHIAKETLARHMSNAGVASESSAVDMIEKGVALSGPIPNINKTPMAPEAVSALATSGQFANVIAAIQSFVTNDLGPDLQLLITVAPEILQLISIFAAL